MKTARTALAVVLASGLLLGLAAPAFAQDRESAPALKACGDLLRHAKRAMAAFALMTREGTRANYEMRAKDADAYFFMSDEAYRMIGDDLTRHLACVDKQVPLMMPAPSSAREPTLEPSRPPPESEPDRRRRDEDLTRLRDRSDEPQDDEDTPRP